MTSRASELIMSCGVLLDFLVSILPIMGGHSFEDEPAGDKLRDYFCNRMGLCRMASFSCCPLAAQRSPHRSISQLYNGNSNCLVHRLYRIPVWYL